MLRSVNTCPGLRTSVLGGVVPRKSVVLQGDRRDVVCQITWYAKLWILPPFMAALFSSTAQISPYHPSHVRNKTLASAPLSDLLPVPLAQVRIHLLQSNQTDQVLWCRQWNRGYDKQRGLQHSKRPGSILNKMRLMLSWCEY